MHLPGAPAVFGSGVDEALAAILRDEVAVNLQAVDGAPGVAASSLDDLCTLNGSSWRDWSVPFYRWLRATRPDPERLRAGLQRYAGWHGLHGWEFLWRGRRGWCPGGERPSRTERR
jgi:hypothetical protein